MGRKCNAELMCCMPHLVHEIMISQDRSYINDGDDLQVSDFTLGAHTLHHISLFASTERELLRDMAEKVRELRAETLSQLLYYPDDAGGASPGRYEESGWPVVCLSGNNPSGVTGVSGQATVLSGASAASVKAGGRMAGRWWEDTEARYCTLTGILPPDGDAGRDEQVRAVLRLMDEALGRCGMGFTDIVRTWFFNDRITDWYDDFNRVRTEFLEGKGVFEGLLPASTGIGSANSGGAALVASAMAVRPKNGAVSAMEIDSPLQPPATSYRSSFSRAVELSYAGGRYLYISGTSAIDEAGRSVCPDSSAGQVEHTMRVVEELLNSRDMTWEDVLRSIVYVKRPEDRGLFRRYCSDNRIPPFPCIELNADICREELLFEIELDAFRAAV